jgi:hypothetical protein
MSTTQSYDEYTQNPNTIEYACVLPDGSQSLNAIQGFEWYRYCSCLFFSAADSKLLSDNEIRAWRYLYLMQAFAAFYCNSAGIQTVGPVFTSGYNEIPVQQKFGP